MSLKEYSADTVFLLIFALLWAITQIEVCGKRQGKHTFPTINFFGSTLYSWYSAFVGIWIFFYLAFGRSMLWGTHSVFKSVFQFLFFVTMWLFLKDLFWISLNPYYSLRKLNSSSMPWIKYWIADRIPCYFVLLVFLGMIFAFVEGTGYLFYSLAILFFSALFLVYTAPFAYQKFYIQTHSKI